MTPDDAPPDAKAVRAALRDTLISSASATTSLIVLEELGICQGQVRVDLAIVDHLFHGYEIKSDRDNLHRLVRQVRYYSEVFDRATLVVGHRHLDEAIHCLPSWWGVLRFSDEGGLIRFQSVRPSHPNPRPVARALVELLWRDDVLALLRTRDLHLGMTSKPRRDLWDRACAHFHLHDIAQAVKAHLMARGGPAIVP